MWLILKSVSAEKIQYIYSLLFVTIILIVIELIELIDSAQLV